MISPAIDALAQVRAPIAAAGRAPPRLGDGDMNAYRYIYIYIYITYVYYVWLYMYVHTYIAGVRGDTPMNGGRK